MSANSKPKNKAIPWKERLLAVTQMMRKNRGSAYRVAVELTAVYRDDDFLADPAIAGDDNKAVKLLDSYAEALFVILPEGRHAFLDLKAMLEHYPEQSQWIDGSLSEMYDAMVEAQARPSEPAPVKRRAPISNAVHEEVKAERDQWKVQAESAIQRADTLAVKVDTAQDQIERLESELAESRRRIKELERKIAELRGQMELEPAGV